MARTKQTARRALVSGEVQRAMLPTKRTASKAFEATEPTEATEKKKARQSNKLDRLTRSRPSISFTTKTYQERCREEYEKYPVFRPTKKSETGSKWVDKMVRRHNTKKVREFIALHKHTVKRHVRQMISDGELVNFDTMCRDLYIHLGFLEVADDQ